MANDSVSEDQYDHLLVAWLGNLARVLLASGAPTAALPLAEAALAGHHNALGADYVWTKDSARVTADALAALGRDEEAAVLRLRYGLESEGG